MLRDLQSAFRRARLFSVAFLFSFSLALIAGCTPSDEEEQPPEGASAASPLAGASVKLVVVGDHALADAVRLLRGEWQGSTGAKLEIEEQTLEELLKLEKLSADAVIYPAEYMGELAERDWLLPVPSTTLNDPLAAWQEIFEADRSRIAAWGAEAYGIPFGSPVLTCCYRADLLQQLKCKPPETWAEYQELVELLSDREKLGDAAPAAGQTWFAAAEPLAKDWAGLTLLARAAPYAKHHNHYSTLFDMDSMEPLIAGPPFVRALDELAAAAKHGAEAPLDVGPEQARQALAAGECALALTWPAPARSQEQNAGDKAGSKGAAPLALGFCELPGAPEVYNIGSKSWDKRRSESGPRVPLLGVAGRLGSISKTSSASDAAAQLLAWLSGPKWGTRVSTASPAATLYRESHLAAPSEWMSFRVEEPAALQYAESVEQALSREESLTAPRIPGSRRYLAALDEAVHQVVSGQASSQEALDAAAEAWRKITDELGLEAQRSAYHRDLGLR
ncbi:MAG TPA: extracellular solute-binding protein [Pirellulales bacterium]|nr:extracellular solute-binding protein [Pirellulales bacterium]